MSAKQGDSLLAALPLGWEPERCPVRPGIRHDGFLMGDERSIERSGGGTLTEVVHQCRKCGARCRWVKLASDV